MSTDCYLQLAALSRRYPTQTIIVRDVAGLKGFSIALNAFSDKRHKKLFDVYGTTKLFFICYTSSRHSVVEIV